MKWMLFMVIGLLCLGSVQALQITEVMYNPLGTDTGREWVEVYSVSVINGSAMSLFNDAGNHKVHVVQGNELFSGYAIIANDASQFLLEHEYVGNLLEASFSLKNTGETIGLKVNNAVEENASYTGEYGNGNGKSIEKIGNSWQESSVLGGTPGFGSQNVPEFSTVAAAIGLCVSAGLFFVMRKKD